MTETSALLMSAGLTLLGFVFYFMLLLRRQKKLHRRLRAMQHIWREMRKDDFSVS